MADEAKRPEGDDEEDSPLGVPSGETVAPASGGAPGFKDAPGKMEASPIGDRQPTGDQAGMRADPIAAEHPADMEPAVLRNLISNPSPIDRTESQDSFGNTYFNEGGPVSIGGRPGQTNRQEVSGTQARASGFREWNPLDTQMSYNQFMGLSQPQAKQVRDAYGLGEGGFYSQRPDAGADPNYLNNIGLRTSYEKPTYAYEAALNERRGQPFNTPMPGMNAPQAFMQDPERYGRYQAFQLEQAQRQLGQAQRPQQGQVPPQAARPAFQEDQSRPFTEDDARQLMAGRPQHEGQPGVEEWKFSPLTGRPIERPRD